MMVCSMVLAAVLPLFEGGKTAWTIETDGNAALPVKYAAEELANALGRVSGATFAVTNGVAGPKIVIGVMPDDGRAGARPSRFGACRKYTRRGVAIIHCTPKAGSGIIFLSVKRMSL